MEKYRVDHPFAQGVRGDEYNGAFHYKNAGNHWAIIASNGGGWDHVSVSLINRKRTPTWEEMCAFKDMFFFEHEVVIQIHPKKEDYVNLSKNCLHLWRYHGDQPTPPKRFV